MTTATKSRKARSAAKARRNGKPHRKPKARVPETQAEAAAKAAAAGDGPTTPFKPWRELLGALIDTSGALAAPLNDVLRTLWAEGKSPEDAVTVLKAQHAALWDRAQRKARETSTPPATSQAVYDLPVSHVHRNAYNPRETIVGGTDFDQGIEELAESIKREGLLQPIEVRADAFQAGHYEIIAGERRWIAHRLLKAKTIRCLIVDITDEEAKSHCVEENLRRKDLNPIERAKSLQLLADIGLTQAAIAKRVGYANDSQVTNELALLKLPDEWQTAVAAGEMPPTHTRFLHAFRERVGVMKCALSLYRKRMEADGHVSQRMFQTIVNDAIRKCSRSMSPGSWGDACPFSPTDEQREQLDIVDVPNVYTGDPEPRAFNTRLWKELANAAKEKDKQQAAAAADSPPAKAETEPVQEWRVRDAVREWLAARIAEALPKLKGEAALKACVVLMMDCEFTYELAEALLPKKGKQHEGDHVRAVFRLKSGELVKRLPQAMTEALQTIVAAGGCGLHLAFAALRCLAEALGIDYGAWRPTADTFAIYGPTMLKQLAEKVGVEPNQNMEALCAALAEKWPAGKYPPGFAPKAIAKL